MLASVSPQQFDEWLAYERLEPEPVGRLIEVTKRGLALLAAVQGAKIDPEDLDPLQPERESAARTVGPQQAVAMIRAAYGA